MPKAKVTDIDVQLGRQLRAFRRARKITQTELGQSIGVTYQQIQKYEIGSSRMSVGTLLQFADLFDVPVESFFVSTAAKPTKPNRNNELDGQVAQATNAFAAIHDDAVRRQLIGLMRSMAAAQVTKGNAARRQTGRKVR